jgi:hypothetical protein
MLNHQLISASELLQRLAQTTLPDSQSKRIQAWIQARNPRC